MGVRSSFSPLFNVQTEHSYFSDNLCRALTFVPTPKTDAVMRNAGLLIRDTINGFRVFYDQPRRDALLSCAAAPDEPLSLEFLGFSRDPLLGNYTEPSIYKEGSILYFSNQISSDADVDTDGRSRLNREDFVGSADFQELGSPFLRCVSSQRNGRLNPILVVSIGVSEDYVSTLNQPSTASAKNYFISFRAQQTIWKYYLLGDLAKADFYVTDREQQIEFIPVGETSLADNRVALTFRSKTFLPFRERSNYHFQLRDQNSGGGRVLIRRLPVASPGQIGGEIVDGQKTFVSEMFINR